MGDTLSLTLALPGMSRLHRVGLAGLWASLRFLEDQRPGSPCADVQWELEPNGVTLRFPNGWDKGIAELLRQTFRLTDDGFVWMPAVGDPHADPQRAVLLQEALLATFLQHGKSREADSRQRPTGAVTITVDDVQRPVRYRRVKSYKHQDPPWRPRGELEVVTWLLPGGAERHTGLGRYTRLVEPRERALCLLFLPAGAFYYRVEPVLQEPVRWEAALVLADPVPGRLDYFAELRRSYLRFGADRLVVAGPAEAALRLAEAALDVAATGVVGDMEVWTFARTAWAPQQRYRAKVDIHMRWQAAVQQFRAARSYLDPPRIRVPRPAETHRSNDLRADVPQPAEWMAPQSAEWVAANLLAGRPWWAEFAEFLGPRERREVVLEYEKGGLAKMVRDKTLLPPGPERMLVDAVQEAWRRRLGQLAERAREQGSDFHRLASSEFERWRVAFARSRNEATVREVLADLLARTGPHPQLHGRLCDILATCRDWRKARDLALLALAGYAGQETEGESAASEVSA